VSGDARVVLVAETGSVPYRAVAQLAQLTPELPPFAVIGGLRSERQRSYLEELGAHADLAVLASEEMWR
jgi:hypothetical protein